MINPISTAPVIAFYQPYGPKEHTLSVVASYHSGVDAWLICETQEYLGWPVVSWAPIPRQTNIKASYAEVSAEAASLLESCYYMRNDLADLGNDISLSALKREQLITTLNQLVFEAQELAKALVLTRP